MSLFHDMRIGFRSLSKDTAFSAVAILTLTLAIGANTAIFSIVNAVLLRPLPYPEASRIVQVQEATQNFAGSISWPNLYDLRQQNTTLESVAAFTYNNLTLHAGANPERLRGQAVTSNYFHVLGLSPLLGRTFTPQEEQPGSSRVVVLSEAVWKTDFASAAGIVGQTITLDGEPFTVIGVMPSSPSYPLHEIRAWIPLVPDAKEVGIRGDHILRAIARLKPNVTFAQAQQELTLIASNLARAYPDSQQKRTFRITTLQDLLVEGTRPTLLALLAAVGFVLLIACANVTNLLLARSTKRRRETAIRLALGASRGQLLKQFIGEGTILALISGVLGVLLAKAVLASLIAWAGPHLPRAEEVTLDLRVLAFSIVLSLLTGFLCGIAPALQASRGDVQDALKQGGTSAGSPQTNWVTGLLAVSEVAVALVLLVGAGLLIRSMLRLQQVDPGFRAEHVVAIKLSLPEHNYTPEAAGRFFRDLLHRVSTFPGVESAAAISLLPVDQYGYNGSLNIPGVPQTNEVEWAIEMRYVTPDLFRTLGIPLLRGRDFTDEDFGKNARSVLINQKFADMIAKYREPMGLQIRNDDSGPQDPMTIVGIVGDVHQAGLDVPVRPEVYMLNDRSVNIFTSNTMNVVIRAEGDPTAALDAIRHEVAAMDPNLATYSVQTMETVLDNSIADRKFTRTLMMGFAVLGTLLAVMGIYSVLSYLVTQHTREIGIRLALGARPVNVVGMVVNQGIAVGAVGLVIGLLVGLGLMRLLSGILFGVKSYDLPTFASAAALLFVVVLLASYIPARRTTKVDPMIALRQD